MVWIFNGDIKVSAAGLFRLEVNLDGEMALPLDDERFEFRIQDVFAGNWISCRDNHVSLQPVLLSH
jgi:hypothetical protein